MKAARVREIRALASRAGLKFESAKDTGSGHIKAVMRAPDGRICSSIFAATPSDWRSDKNNLSRLRRIAKEAH